MLRELSEKRIVPILKDEFNKDPQNFAKRIKENVVKEISKNHVEELPLFADILFNSVEWKDLDEAFVFLNNHVNFLESNIKSTKNGESNERNVFLVFVKMLESEKIRSGLETLVVDYLNNCDKRKAIELAARENFNIRAFAIENRIKPILKIFPAKDDVTDVKNLIGIFKRNKYNVKNVINIENFEYLSDNGKKMFMENIFNLIDESLLNVKLTSNSKYSVEPFTSLLSKIKDALDDKTKSDLIRRIPQLTYYREMSSALSMKFNSKNFVGTPWDRLIEIALHNREVANGEEQYYKSSPDYKKFQTENAWNDFVLKSRDKFKDVDNHMGKDVVFAFMSFYKKISPFSESYVFEKEIKSSEKIEINNGPENLLAIRKNFKDDVRLIDFIVDEFNNDKSFVTRIVKTQRFKDNLDVIADKLDYSKIKENLNLKSPIVESNISFLCMLSSSGLNIEKVYLLLNQDERNLLAIDLLNNLNKQAEINTAYCYSILSVADKKIIMDKEIDDNCHEGLKIVLNKLKMEFLLKSDLSDDISPDNNSSSFKI